jgi:putative ABC transport system permease protein
MTGKSGENGEREPHENDAVYSNAQMYELFNSVFAAEKNVNNLTAFRKHLEDNYDQIADAVSDIQYTYDFDMQIFTSDGKTQVSPTTVFDNMGDAFSGVTEMMEASGMSSMGGMSIMSEMINNQELLDQQYEVIAGDWPQADNEVVLVVSRNNQLSKMTLYMLGVLDQSELEDIMKDLMTNGEYDTTPLEPYSFDYFLDMTFRLVNTADFYGLFRA